MDTGGFAISQSFETAGSLKEWPVQLQSCSTSSGTIWTTGTAWNMPSLTVAHSTTSSYYTLQLHNAELVFVFHAGFVPSVQEACACGWLTYIMHHHATSCGRWLRCGILQLGVRRGWQRSKEPFILFLLTPAVCTSVIDLASLNISAVL